MPSRLDQIAGKGIASWRTEVVRRLLPWIGFVVIIVLVLGAKYAGSSGPSGVTTPRLDAERLVGLQHGESPGVATCPVSQRATATTHLKAVRGTLTHWYWDRAVPGQRAQLLAAVIVHDTLPEEGIFSGHGDVDQRLGENTILAAWNMRLAPRRGSESIPIRMGFGGPGRTVPAGWYVSLCVWVNNTNHPRYGWESQLNLITDQSMETVRRRPVCDC